MEKLSVIKRSVTLNIANGESTKAVTYSGVNPALTPAELQEGIDALASLFANTLSSSTVNDKANIVDED